MNIILFDDKFTKNLWPLTFTRPVSELRVGILRLREKWTNRIDGAYSWQTSAYLQKKYPLKLETKNLLINASVCPTDELTKRVLSLSEGEGLKYNELAIALYLSKSAADSWLNKDEGSVNWIEYDGEIDSIKNTWDIHEQNEVQLKRDFDLITKGRKSQTVSKTNQLIGNENIFVEEGAKIECSIINAETGPVYIGRNATILEGSLIRGPFALCDHAQVNMGSKIYGATTIGPFSKVGGEIAQSVVIGYSNKGHDGFLGHSVIGEWCNLGAGTNVSNLKNTYDKVKVWSYSENRFAKTGLQFSGLIMGDHSKAGISTMINTGTVIGAACNIHGAGFSRQFVPSFADGGASGYKVHQLKSACNIAEKVMSRRSVKFTEVDREILQNVFELTSAYRKF